MGQTQLMDARQNIITESNQNDPSRLVALEQQVRDMTQNVHQLVQQK